MSDFWRIYDELIEGMDPCIKVGSVLCGHTWTAVISQTGDIGMAMTTPGESRPRTSIAYQGKPLREVAALVKSWNFLEASVGMAAINAFYNTMDRMNENGWEQPDNAFCHFGLDVKGKTLGMVGHLKHNDTLFEGAKDLFILEMNTRDGDYPSSACEDLIPKCDIVMITGSAFTNKTMPRLLELAKDAFTIITGPSTPMAELLVQDFNIQRIAGFIPEDKDTLKQFIAAGCFKAPYDYGRRFYIDR